MNKEENIRNSNIRLIEQGNLDAVKEFFSPDYTAHAEDKAYKGHEFIKRYCRQLRKALPDISVVKVVFLVAAGDKIAWQRTLSGTHKGKMMGIPPSAKTIRWNEMVVSRFEANLIAEEWVVSELAEKLLSKQSGVR